MTCFSCFKHASRSHVGKGEVTQLVPKTTSQDLALITQKTFITTGQDACSTQCSHTIYIFFQFSVLILILDGGKLGSVSFLPHLT